MKKINKTILFGLFILIIEGFSFSAHADYKISTSCPEKSEKSQLKISSEVHLIKGREAFTEEFITNTIKQQILYYKSDLKYKTKKEVTDLVFLDQEPQIKIIETKDSLITRRYDIFTVKHRDVQITLPYLKNLIQKKNINKNSLVMSIQYEAEIGLFTCAKESVRNIVKNQTLKAPADPWLAHWLLDKKYLQHVKWNESEFKIPPYFDAEYADLPHPELAWYFWNPQLEGLTKNKKTYKADVLLKDVKEISTTGLAVVESQVLPQQDKLANSMFSSDKPELKATVIFGVTDAKMKQLDLKAIFKKHSSGRIKQWDQVEAELYSWNQKAGIDPGSLFATGFLTNLTHFANRKSLVYEYNAATHLLTVNALLNKSRKPIRINFYFGPTDVLAGLPPAHWQAAYNGITDDDIIFYIGHSGLGENFKWQNIVENAKPRVPASEVAAKSRIIGIFSCYSASYFENDMSQFLNSQSLLILTGSSYTSARGPVGILDWVDKTLTSKTPDSVSLVLPNDFLIYKKAGLSL